MLLLLETMNFLLPTLIRN